MNTDLPIIAALNPDRPPEVPEGATIFESKIRGGLPHVIPLFPRWQAILSLPTGTAAGWLETAADTPIDAGAPRLRFQFDRITRHVIPLVAGPSFLVINAGGLCLEASVLDWTIHAGDMVGPANLGSFIRIAVRTADKANNEFGLLPPSDFVFRSLAAEDKRESRSEKRVVRTRKKRGMLRGRAR